MPGFSLGWPFVPSPMETAVDDLLDAMEAAHYASSGLPQAGQLGKLRDVAAGLLKAGMNPMVIFSLIQSILHMLASVPVEDIINKILALFMTPAGELPPGVKA